MKKTVGIFLVFIVLGILSPLLFSQGPGEMGGGGGSNPEIPISTNGFVTASVTNGLAPMSITNGLAPVPETVWLHASGFAAYGSTDTKIPRFTSAITNTGQGTAWTYTTNAANGSTLTILQSGIYSISVSFASAANNYQYAGITLNEALSTTTQEMYFVQGSTNLGFGWSGPIAGQSQGPTWSVTLPLKANDVIRAHTAGSTPSDATTPNKFMVTQVSK